MNDQVMAGEKRGPGRPPKMNATPVVELPAEKPADQWADKPIPPPMMPEKPKTIMLPVKLLKNYRPRGEYEITIEAPPPMPGVTGSVKEKNAEGKWVEVGRKIWAGSTVNLPHDEAVALLTNEVVTREAVVDGEGHALRDGSHSVIYTMVKAKKPLAERADPLPDGRAA